MDPEPLSSAAFEFVGLVARSYASLAETPLADSETGLGGRFFYAGELDDTSSALVVAANISGAATLAATARHDAQKRALRDGVADFLVSSLDESLRILKNQLRKRETASVCVALPPEEVESQMRERGVAPDLLRAGLSIAPYHEAFRLEQGEETGYDLSKIPAVVAWRVGSAPAQWLPHLDAIALECLDADDWPARRWLRLAPRYLGRMAQGLRFLDCDREFAARFIERVRQQVDRGEIAFAFEIVSYFRGLQDQFRFDPAKS